MAGGEVAVCRSCVTKGGREAGYCSGGNLRILAADLPDTDLLGNRAAVPTRTGLPRNQAAARIRWVAFPSLEI